MKLHALFIWHTRYKADILIWISHIYLLHFKRNSRMQEVIYIHQLCIDFKDYVFF
jgi:hypothetical protein